MLTTGFAATVSCVLVLCFACTSAKFHNRPLWTYTIGWIIERGKLEKSLEELDFEDEIKEHRESTYNALKDKLRELRRKHKAKVAAERLQKQEAHLKNTKMRYSLDVTDVGIRYQRSLFPQHHTRKQSCHSPQSSAEVWHDSDQLYDKSPRRGSDSGNDLGDDESLKRDPERGYDESPRRATVPATQRERHD